MTQRVAGLVLAAGEGRRFGGPKAVVELDGERLVDRAVGVLREAGLPAYVVHGAVPLEVAGAESVANPEWREGMGGSLRAGLRALPAPTVAAVVIPVDQPGIRAAAIGRAIAAARPDLATALVVATYDGRPGHPVLLGRAHWPGIANSATGDQGARDYLASRPDEVVSVECGDISGGADVDRPEDLDAFRGTSA